MNDENKQQLWRRETSFLVVEIRVGNVWVEHAREKTMSDATRCAGEALRDSAVRAVRICEHDIVQTNTVVYEKGRAPELRVARGMRSTARREQCPVCKKSAPVTTDGANDWIMCTECNRALPAA